MDTFKQDMDKWASRNLFHFLLNNQLCEDAEKEMNELIDKYSVEEVRKFLLKYDY